MKLQAVTLIFIFMSFIALPTILSRVYSDIDISMAYNLVEEEENHSNPVLEEIKCYPAEEIKFDLIGFDSSKETFHKEFCTSHDNISREICSPPPELVLV